MKAFVVALCIAIVFAVFGLPFLLPEPLPPAPPSARDWGAFTGPSPEDTAEFERLVGRRMTNRATFVHWGNEREFPTELARSLDGQTLTIFWEAKDYNDPSTNQPNYSFEAILRGDWDDYLLTFAQQVRDYGGPVILIPFEEMNGDWNPWSGTLNGNTPERFIEAYRYIRSFFEDVPNVRFGWAVNNQSRPDTPENAIDVYYPGDEAVDIVGVDGFNFGDPWQSFDEVFSDALEQLATYRKPVYIFSMASAEGPRKADWIRDALGRGLQQHPEVAGWIWFNENKERDWRIWSDPQSLAAFRESLD